MAVLDLHLQFFIVAVGEIATDPKHELIAIERGLTHDRPSARPCVARETSLHIWACSLCSYWPPRNPLADLLHSLDELTQRQAKPRRAQSAKRRRKLRSSTIAQARVDTPDDRVRIEEAASLVIYPLVQLYEKCRHRRLGQSCIPFSGRKLFEIPRIALTIHRR